MSSEGSINISSCSLGIIHLLCTENFPISQHFLPPDTHNTCAYQSVRGFSFFRKYYVCTKLMTLKEIYCVKL